MLTHVLVVAMTVAGASGLDKNWTSDVPDGIGMPQRAEKQAFANSLTCGAKGSIPFGSTTCFS